MTLHELSCGFAGFTLGWFLTALAWYLCLRMRHD
jgi:hypothetical protein